jgi:hypothetical protein
MTLQWIQIALAAVGLFVTIELAVIGWMWHAQRKEEEERSAGDKRLHERIDGFLEKFGACQVICARTFATHDDLHRTHEQIREDLREIKAQLQRLAESLRQGERP